jgi:ribosomal protein S18 acetylase RimI-like enzyme
MHATGITIRSAQPADAPLLSGIEERCFPEPHWDAESFLRYDCIVALMDGVIAGFLVSRLVFSSAVGPAGEREILNVVVDIPYRRKGLGKLLLATELERGGIHFLEVRESNAGARRLYENHGFQDVSIRKHYYQSPRENAILMKREAPVAPVGTVA